MVRFSNEHTLLWKEEPDCLAAWAEAVPQGGCIVEIGTADGGSARIMREVSPQNKVDIYTVDIAPSENAYKLLAETDVQIIRTASSEFAARWDTERKIDLLFIDGDHSFKGVYEDFISWAPHLAKNGKVLFHDVDPSARGGLAHFGVQVFVDGIIHAGILANPLQQYRFVYGEFEKTLLDKLNCALFVGTLQRMDGQLHEIMDKVFSDGPEKAVNLLRERAFGMTSMQACCFVGRLLHENYHLLLDAGDKFEIMRWAEAVWMMEHAFPDFTKPEQLCPDKLGRIKNCDELSRLLAGIQSAAFLYRNIARNILTWDL